MIRIKTTSFSQLRRTFSSFNSRKERLHELLGGWNNTTREKHAGHPRVCCHKCMRLIYKQLWSWMRIQSRDVMWRRNLTPTKTFRSDESSPPSIQILKSDQIYLFLLMSSESDVWSLEMKTKDEQPFYILSIIMICTELRRWRQTTAWTCKWKYCMSALDVEYITLWLFKWFSIISYQLAFLYYFNLQTLTELCIFVLLTVDLVSLSCWQTLSPPRLCGW